MSTMATSNQSVRVIDLVTAEDIGILCDTCSDPIDRGELIAVLSNGAHVHDDSFCRYQAGSDLTDSGRHSHWVQDDYLLGYM